MKPNRSIRELVRPRKTVLVAFCFLWTIVLQYPLFILFFPDGGMSSIRAMLNAVLEVLMTPIDYLQILFEPMLEYGYFPGHVGIPILMLYFYLLAVVMASLYESITSQLKNRQQT